jgi:predicted MFS family arabinose efflux permease
MLGFYLTGLLGRVPMGMVGLLVVLVVAQSTGGFAVAGAASGALAVGFGVISPFRARLVDRRGARSVLLSSGLAHALSLTLLWPLARMDATPVVLVGVALLIGATLPPTGAVMRSAWSAMVPDGPRRHAAHTAESLAVQSTLLVGPVIVAAATLTVGAGWGLLCCAGLTLSTSLALGLSSRLAAALPSRSAPETGPGRAVGALRVRALLLVLPSGFWLFAAVNAVEITAAAQAVAASAAWAAGWLIAGFGVGGLIGGVAWGWRVWPGRVPVQAVAILVPFGAMLAVLAVGLPLPVVGILLFAAGATFPPVMTAQFSVLDAVMPRELLTESFGWLNAARQAGTAVAGAAAGLAVDAFGPPGGWLVGAGCAVLAIATSAILPAPESSDGVED